MASMTFWQRLCVYMPACLVYRAPSERREGDTRELLFLSEQASLRIEITLGPRILQEKAMPCTYTLLVAGRPAEVVTGNLPELVFLDQLRGLLDRYFVS